MRRMGVLMAAVFVVVVGCSSDDGTESSSTSSSTTTTTSAAPSTTTMTPPPPPPPAPEPPIAEPTYEAPAAVEAVPTVQLVVLGDYCSSRGAPAPTADGSTAYCTRLAGTDAYVWSLTQGVASNPNAQEQQTGNSLLAPGDICYDSSATATDSQGQTLYCNPYADESGAVNVLRWQLTP